MRRPILPLALALALATGFALAETRLVVLAPAVALDSQQSNSNTAVIRQFYDAINHAVDAGDVAPLGRLLGAGFVEHTHRPGFTSDADALVRFVQALHASQPRLWLTVIDAFAAGDRVTAVVRIDEDGATPVAGLPAVAGRVWGTLDVFRLRAGRIVEHWGDDAGLAAVEPLVATTVAVEPPATKIVELARQTYPPHAADRHWASGPTILILESGTLTVALDALSTEAAAVVRASGENGSVVPGAAVVLTAGDALILERRSLYATRNDGATTAVARTLWAGDPTFPSGGGARRTAGDALPGTATPRATYEALAGGFLAELPPDRAAVAVGRISLAPGAALPAHRVANLELAVVEAGRLELAVADGRAWIRKAPDAPTRAETGAVLGAGTGLVFDPGTTVAIRPAGDEPLTVLMVVIGPAGDRAPA